MRRVADAQGGAYQPTPAYRIHVRELSREDVWYDLPSVAGDSRW